MSTAAQVMVHWLEHGMSIYFDDSVHGCRGMRRLARVEDGPDSHVSYSRLESSFFWF